MIHKAGLQRLRLTKGTNLISAVKVFFQSENYKNGQQKGVSWTLMYSLDLEYHLHLHRMRYKKDVDPRKLLCHVCKNEIEHDSHVQF